MTVIRAIFSAIALSLFIIITPFLAWCDDNVDDSYIKLSAETNGVRAGLYINNTNGVIEITIPGFMVTTQSLSIYNCSTNRMLLFAPKTIEEAFDLRLVDSSGALVEKTRFGQKLGQPLRYSTNTISREWNRLQLMPFSLPPNEHVVYEHAQRSISDVIATSYSWSKEGVYNLVLIQRYYLKNTNKMTLFPVELPLTVTVRVKKVQ